jgi:HEPN domain-containing protein
MTAQGLCARGQEFLDAARASRDAGRSAVAYEEARTAAELFAKALLLVRLGSFPHKHPVGGLLQQHGLIPSGVSPRALSRLLSDSTRGAYDVGDRPSDDEVEDAIALASRMRKAAEAALP